MKLRNDPIKYEEANIRIRAIHQAPKGAFFLVVVQSAL